MHWVARWMRASCRRSSWATSGWSRSWRHGWSPSCAATTSCGCCSSCSRRPRWPRRPRDAGPTRKHASQRPRRRIERCGDRLCLPYITSTRAAIECSRGDYGSALASGRAAVTAAQSGGWWEPWARTDLGATLLELHDLPAAIAQLDAAVATSTLAAQQVRSLAHLASAHWRAGARERAMTELHRAETLLATVTAPPGQTYLFGADAALACAEVRLDRGETERAEALLAPIVTAAEAGGWREPLARGLLLVGRCRQAAADAPGARMLAERALDVARDTVLPGVTWQAHAVLAGLSDAGQAWLGQARHGVMDLSAALPDAALRTTFVEAALAEVDVLARRHG